MASLEEIDYVMRSESTDLSSIYQDILEPVVRETYVPRPQFHKKKGKGKYHWGKVEQKRYVDFLLENMNYFELSPNDRRVMGINSRMSKIIKTRDTNQCRSHHQKMLIKFDSVERIISEFQCLLCPKNQKKWA